MSEMTARTQAYADGFQAGEKWARRDFKNGGVREPRSSTTYSDVSIAYGLGIRRGYRNVLAMAGDVARCTCGAAIGADGENGPICDAGHDVWERIA